MTVAIYPNSACGVYPQLCMRSGDPQDCFITTLSRRIQVQCTWLQLLLRLKFLGHSYNAGVPFVVVCYNTIDPADIQYLYGLDKLKPKQPRECYFCIFAVKACTGSDS